MSTNANPQPKTIQKLDLNQATKTLTNLKLIQESLQKVNIAKEKSNISNTSTLFSSQNKLISNLRQEINKLKQELTIKNVEYGQLLKKHEPYENFRKHIEKKLQDWQNGNIVGGNRHISPKSTEQLIVVGKVLYHSERIKLHVKVSDINKKGIVGQDNSPHSPHSSSDPGISKVNHGERSGGRILSHSDSNSRDHGNSSVKGDIQKKESSINALDIKSGDDDKSLVNEKGQAGVNGSDPDFGLDTRDSGSTEDKSSIDRNRSHIEEQARYDNYRMSPRRHESYEATSRNRMDQNNNRYDPSYGPWQDDIRKESRNERLQEAWEEREYIDQNSYEEHRNEKIQWRCQGTNNFNAPHKSAVELKNDHEKRLTQSKQRYSYRRLDRSYEPSPSRSPLKRKSYSRFQTFGDDWTLKQQNRSSQVRTFGELRNRPSQVRTFEERNRNPDFQNNFDEDRFDRQPRSQLRHSISRYPAKRQSISRLATKRQSQPRLPPKRRKNLSGSQASSIVKNPRKPRKIFFSPPRDSLFE